MATINDFDSKLNELYRRMILGIHVRITPEFRKEWGRDNIGQWFYIQAMHDDETFTIVGRNHDMFTGCCKGDLIV